MPNAGPLSDEEREELRRRTLQRVESVSAKIDDVFAFRRVSEPPVIINGAIWWAFASDTTKLPDDYFKDPAVMVAHQERMALEQMREVDDDYVGYCNPWMGTTVPASSLGSTIVFVPKMDPAVDPESPAVATPEDIRRLRVPDPARDGLMPKILQFLDYMKANSVLPLGVTDSQGPLTTANLLMGYDKLMYLMYDDPRATHDLFEVVTETLIMWTKTQKALMGEPRDAMTAALQVYVGPHAGVWISDDDATLLPPDLYREFVVPYNQRMFETFGGGVLHFCGNASHQVPNFLDMKDLRAINNYTLHNFKAVSALQQGIRGRIALFACDFTPIDYKSYFDGLLDAIDVHEGTVLLQQYSTVLGMLPTGRYETVERPPSGRADVHRELMARLALAAAR